MEKFKQEIWEKDKLHLEYHSLDDLQIQQVLYKLSNTYNIPIDHFNNSSIFIKIVDILNKNVPLLNINEKNGFKDLCSLLKLDISPNNVVYLIWNYNNIDKIQANILQDYWDYIWYGPSDEMCLLYFSSIKSLVMITDYGTISTR